MFFERVPITTVIGTTAAQIFDQYGIEHSRLNPIINLPQNEPLRRSVRAPIQLQTPLTPGAGSIVLPIDITVSVSRAVPRVDMADGLRPLPRRGGVLDRSQVSRCTHGVEILLDRTGRPCNRIRWLQTVKKQNNPDPTQPREFVDIGGNGLPWYNIGVDPDPTRFDDLPCGPAAHSPGTGLQFLATVSVAIWTMERITLVKGCTYGFTLAPGTTIGAVRWSPSIRPATDLEMKEQVRILEAGVNQFRQATGGRLIYNPPPADATINEGILFGRF
jgi:hypothetical protein